MSAAPTGLPVEAVTDELVGALRRRGLAVLVAEPGAGKTTVVPLRLLDAGICGPTGRLVVLEPRRLAARAAAARMASLLGEAVGDTVGVVTRDERRVSAATRIEVVTEGVLTRRLQRDPSLTGTAVVVFDEFHERSVQGDLGLALTLDVRRSLRPDLAVVVMSATLDAARVADLLGDGDEPAPVLQCAGRTHPVDLTWAPRRGRDRLEGAVASAVRRALRDDPGDVLVFLPGIAEIRRTRQALADAGVGPPGVEVHELAGSLPTESQDLAITPSMHGQKVVLSTDVAETSLTVEGVSTVVDAGLSRVPRFDPATGMTRLVTVTSSKASADQRAGRAGRLGPGRAVRLWSKVEHAARLPHDPAELTQVDLAGVVMELAVWGVRDPEAPALLDVPPRRAWDEACELLARLGALDGDGRPTALGRQTLGLPLHPRLARMVLLAAEGPRGATACALAALLSERDVLHGRPDEVPADLAVRLELLADRGRSHPRLDGRALSRARRSADDLERRVGAHGAVTATDAGPLLALAYPDRLALRRGTRTAGRFVLRGGGGAWLPATDPLATVEALVAADLDGRRREARIRLAGALDADELDRLVGDDVTHRHELVWDAERDDLVAVIERRLDGLVLSSHRSPAAPGPDTVAALCAQVRRSGLGCLGGAEAAARWRQRVAFLRALDAERWPDLDDDTLLGDLDDWLVPFLGTATGRGDLERLDLAMVLGTRLSWDRSVELAEQAPEHLEVTSGRRVPVDYASGRPVVRVRVQDLFGTTEHPRVAGGRVPVRLELLSPADRAVQITEDLPGFWAGSWHDVRKDMAGRYPKHDWPTDPARARPPRRR